MKRQLFAIIALIAVVGLFFASCDDGGGSPNKLDSITITAAPSKTVYGVGEALSTVGMVVTAVYTDGSRTPVTTFATAGFDSGSEGLKTVTVTFQGKTATFNVAVSGGVAKPTASVRAGTYYTAQSVILSTVTPGASIYYTLDGTIPTASSALYNGAINISANTTLQAVTVKSGETSSVFTAVYYISNLQEGVWADVTAINSIVWFKFKAVQIPTPVATPGSAAPTPDPKADPTKTDQYLYLRTLSGNSTFNIQLYEIDSKTPIDGLSGNLSSGGKLTLKNLTIGKEYCIRATNVSPGGTFRIAFSTDDAAEPSNITLPASAATLDTGKWVNGNFATVGSDQWFRFIAKDTLQYIHYRADILGSLRTIQVFDKDGKQISSSATSISNYYQMSGLTKDDLYYIKVTGGGYINANSVNTYALALADTNTLPKFTMPTAGVTTLTKDTWADGNIPSTPTMKIKEQWFKFDVPTSTTRVYFYFLSNTVGGGTTEFYKADADDKTKASYVNSGVDNLFVTAGDTYYIRAWVYTDTVNTGAFKIAFSDSDKQPKVALPSATTLTADKWADGSITAVGGEQWFKFTAVAPPSTTTAPLTAKQYIHFMPGTLAVMNVELFDSEGVREWYLGNISVGNTVYQSNSNLTVGDDYYIRVCPNGSADTDVGAYRIAFSTSDAKPPVTIPATANFLPSFTWVDGNITAAGGEQWFVFVAKSNTQYIYYRNDLDRHSHNHPAYVQVFDEEGKSILAEKQISSDTSSSTTSASVTAGKVYWIRVRSSNRSGIGTYEIAYTGYNNSSTGNNTRPIIPVSETVNELTVNKWTSVRSSSSVDYRWFKFEATAATPQYIHSKDNTSSQRVYVYLFDETGYTVGNSNWTNSGYMSASLTVGKVYYLRVSINNGGLANITFNSSSTAP